jgi:hypothetical protein
LDAIRTRRSDTGRGAIRRRAGIGADSGIAHVGTSRRVGLDADVPARALVRAVGRSTLSADAVTGSLARITGLARLTFGATAVDVGLRSIQYAVRTRRRRTGSPVTDTALAVVGLRATRVDLAGRTVGTAAIDIGLVAVLDAILAGRRHALAVVADAALAVLVGGTLQRIASGCVSGTCRVLSGLGIDGRDVFGGRGVDRPDVIHLERGAPPTRRVGIAAHRDRDGKYT